MLTVSCVVLWLQFLPGAFLPHNIRLLALAELPEDALRAQSPAGCLGSGTLCGAHGQTGMRETPARIGSSEEPSAP